MWDHRSGGRSHDKILTRGGKLRYNGRVYDFTIGGLGIGGFGASRIRATGKVYGLTRVEDFSGGYFQARYGIVVADKSAEELWPFRVTAIKNHAV